MNVGCFSIYIKLVLSMHVYKCENRKTNTLEGALYTIIYANLYINLKNFVHNKTFHMQTLEKTAK